MQAVQRCFALVPLALVVALLILVVVLDLVAVLGRRALGALALLTLVVVLRALALLRAPRAQDRPGPPLLTLVMRVDFHHEIAPGRWRKHGVLRVAGRWPTCCSFGCS